MFGNEFSDGLYFEFQLNLAVRACLLGSMRSSEFFFFSPIKIVLCALKSLYLSPSLSLSRFDSNFFGITLDELLAFKLK